MKGARHALCMAMVPGSAHNDPVSVDKERAMNRRHDRISAMFIDAVLDASRQHGTTRAARLLHEDGVPLDVALRVLARPGQRRFGPRPPHPLVALAAALVRPFGAAHPADAAAHRSRARAAADPCMGR
jgi:hypothetical protein